MSEWYFHPVGGYGLVVLVAAALLLLLTFWGLPRHRLTPPRRRALLALRLLVIALALFAMLRPALVQTKTKPQAATLVVLIDHSRSMLVADAVGGKTRWEMLTRTLQDALPALRNISENLEVKIYDFDGELHPQDFTGGKLDLKAQPDGEQTAIGAALEDVLRRESGKRLAGVILLSDGAQRAYAPRDLAPQVPARRLSDLGYPLYVLPFGQARGLGQTRDVSLQDLSVNPTVYVKNKLDVHATARLEGFGGQPIAVELLMEDPAGKMQPVAVEQIKATQSGAAEAIDLSTIPKTPGEYKVTLRAKGQPGELVTTNNELSTFVSVLKGGINVLYLEGALRVDSKYLLRSLDASPDIKVDYVRLDAREPTQRPDDMLQRFRRGRYDVYMLGDVDATMLTGEELAALANTVKQGAGLVMLGGFHTFGPGGYADTPLADLLPLIMDPRERQRLGDPIRSDVQLAGPLKMRATNPLGRRHYLMELADGNSPWTVWEQLPALEGANRFGQIKPGAQVLGESTAGQPLLVVHDVGGRVIAFAGDTTWHWWMEGYDSQHKRFWRQVVLWLARKDETTDGNVWIKLAQRRFGPREPVAFSVGAQSPQGDSVADAQFTAEVTFPDGSKKNLPLARQGDKTTGMFDDTLAAGDYTLTITARHAGTELGTTKARFLVYQQDLELDSAAADPTLLASLSAMTKDVGGQSLAPEELPTLLARIQQKPLDVEVETLVKHTPWDTWPFFLLFVSVINAEWYLRKKWGLV